MKRRTVARTISLVSAGLVAGLSAVVIGVAPASADPPDGTDGAITGPLLRAVPEIRAAPAAYPRRAAE